MLPCHPKTLASSRRSRVWTRVEQVAMFAANGLGKMYIAEGGPRDRGGASFFVFLLGGVPELSW